MKRPIRLIAALVLALGMFALSPAAPAQAKRACEGLPVLVMNHLDQDGNVAATSTITFYHLFGGGDFYCAITDKQGSYVGPAHQMTLKLEDELGDFRSSSGTFTSGGPVASALPYLHRCARITVTMSELDGTEVFNDTSPFVHCVNP